MTECDKQKFEYWLQLRWEKDERLSEYLATRRAEPAPSEPLPKRGIKLSGAI